MKPCKIMTDNQNMYETSMKDVQQTTFLFQTGSLRVTEMFQLTLIAMYFVYFVHFS